eukprot:CAMPEP_0174260014 /NCGR_PEP_ID=MMETSP0439-20130205/8766_1 /TAXON_ID=0 /ORGANISM="Stereomyxa ramosa, Strain Chinc5" /LENGTH=206 /DNA_ID=CAMNT_0015344137 /DNA_START=18 /DNA_END=635 /DNA_ORIENTATION=-
MDNERKPVNMQVKTVLVGNSAVGKSSLACRLVNEEFIEQESTVGAGFMTKTVKVEGGTIKFEIWDTAGQERYHSLVPMYYQDAQVAIVVYDLTSQKSFLASQAWVSELQQEIDPTREPTLALCGNKLDLEKHREVSTKEAQSYASQEGLLFIETSAASGENVTKLFEMIAEELVDAVNEGSVVQIDRSSNINLRHQQPQPRQRKCC